MMKFWRTFAYFFTGELELFVSAILLITFGTVIATSPSIFQFFGTTVYFSRIILTILISMAVGGLSIQMSTLKKMSDDYVSFVFVSMAAISNSVAVLLETVEMIMYGSNWVGIEFFGNQQIALNSLLSTLGFIIYFFSIMMTIFSILDLIEISGGIK